MFLISSQKSFECNYVLSRTIILGVLLVSFSLLRLKFPVVVNSQECMSLMMTRNSPLCFIICQDLFPAIYSWFIVISFKYGAWFVPVCMTSRHDVMLSKCVGLKRALTSCQVAKQFESIWTYFIFEKLCNQCVFLCKKKSPVNWPPRRYWRSTAVGRQYILGDDSTAD